MDENEKDGRFPVGDYIWAHLSEPERERLRRFTSLTAEDHYLDEVYCALGNVGVGHPMGEDEPVEDHHVRQILEWMSSARLVDMQMDEGHWRHILDLASPDEESVERLRRLFEVAADVDDEEAFDEDARWDRIEAWEYQRKRLVELGIRTSYGRLPWPARPALVRWAREGGPIPAVDDVDEQLSLSIMAR